MNIGKSKKKSYLILLLPLALILTTTFIFYISSNLFGKDLGYVIGFFFYYIFWCYGTVLALIGKKGFVSLFTELNPLFSKKNWYLIIIFFLIIFGTVIMYLIPSINEATSNLILLAIPIALIHGIGEEALWRGLYIRTFPKNILLGVIYPSVAFALWHLSPQIVFPAENLIAFVGSTLFLGLSYAIIAYKTGSIKWVALIHVLGSLLALGQPITTSIISVLGL
jgi:membrane protease YdiL (CAAX protease family)